jgi:hypothetical protein
MASNPVETAKALASSMSELINTAAVFAAPRVYAKVPDAVVLRQGLLEAIGKYLAAIAGHDRSRGGPENFSRLEAAARDLRALVLPWDPSDELSAAIVEQARACISAFGIPAPSGGWEDFEGWGP